MTRWSIAFACVLAAASGCAARRPFHPPPPPGFACKELPFADSDGFDALLESHLTNRTPAIRILFDTATPDWPPRVVAWLKAYQAGGQVSRPAGKGGLAPPSWLAAGPSSEARAALEALLDRGERWAATAADWWRDERARRARVELLRPYLLDAERDEGRGGHFTLLLYNGDCGEAR